MDKVTTNIWVGDVIDADRLDEDDRFDRVVTVCDCGEDVPEATTDYHPFKDGKCDYGAFSRAVDSLCEAIENDEETLVHCAAGVSRAPTVIATALVVDGSYDNIHEAIYAIRDARPIINTIEPLRDRARFYIISDGSNDHEEFLDWVLDQ